MTNAYLGYSGRNGQDGQSGNAKAEPVASRGGRCNSIASWCAVSGAAGGCQLVAVWGEIKLRCGLGKKLTSKRAILWHVMKITTKLL